MNPPEEEANDGKEDNDAISVTSRNSAISAISEYSTGSAKSVHFEGDDLIPGLMTAEEFKTQFPSASFMDYMRYKQDFVDSKKKDEKKDENEKK